MGHDTSFAWCRQRIGRPDAGAAGARGATMARKGVPGIWRGRRVAGQRLALVALAMALATCGEDALPEPPAMPRPEPPPIRSQLPEQPSQAPPSWKVDANRPTSPTPLDQMAAKDLLNRRVCFRVSPNWEISFGGRGTTDAAATFDRVHFSIPYPVQTDRDAPARGADLAGGVPMIFEDASAYVTASLLPRRQTVGWFSSQRRDAVSPGDRILKDATQGGRRVVVGRRPAERYTWATFDCYQVKGKVGVEFHLEYDLKQKPPAAWRAATDADARAVCASITIDEKQ